MKSTVLSLLLLFATNSMYAQTFLKGVVRDTDEKAIEGAVIKVLEDGKIIAFGITADQGAYELKFQSSQSRLKISFEHLSYKKKVQSLTNESQTISVTLEDNITRLKEVTVSIPKIQQRGDTLSYRLSAFIGKGDVSLEDAMKKIPGIQVEENGSIHYLGKDISNFYIEGLDLLGGRYNLATQNLPASYVTDVEVLNNHQDIRMEKEIHSDQVALNIKLSSKAKFKPVGTSEVLIGYGNEWLYRVGATGMIFTPSFQSIVTAKIGNDKEFALTETTDHFAAQKELNGMAFTAIGNITGNKPPLGNQRFISPDDRMVSVNSIKKTGESSTLKANVDYAYSKTFYTYGTESHYYTGGDEITVKEEISPLSRIHKPALDLEYKFNGDKKYIGDKLSFEADFIERNFLTLENNERLSQDKSARMMDVKNDFSWRIKRGGRFWNVSSLTQYTATPTAKLFINSQAQDYDYVQQAQSNTVLAREQVNTIYEFRHSRVYIPFTLQYMFNDLESNLERNGGDFGNQVYSHDWRLIFSPRYEYQAPNDRFIVRISSWIKGVFFHAKHTLDDTPTGYDKVFIDPKLYFDYTLNSNSSLQLKSDIVHAIGDIVDLLTAPIQNSYRTQTVKSGLLGRNRRFSANLRYEFKKPLDFWFLNADLSYRNTKQNLLSSQYVTEKEITVSNRMSDHTSQDVMAGLSVTKLIEPIQTKMTLSGSYIWQQRQILQQEQVIPYYGSSYGIYPSLVSRPWNWMEIAYQGDFSETFNRYQGTESSYSSQTHNVKLSVFPIAKLRLSGQYNYVRKEVSSRIYKGMSLFDVGIQYKIKACKFSLEVNNILDLKRYSYTLFNGLDSFAYDYYLRGREFMVSVTLSK